MAQNTYPVPNGTCGLGDNPGPYDANYNLHINRVAIPVNQGTGERLFKGTVTDAVEHVSISNGISSLDSLFMPILWGNDPRPAGSNNKHAALMVMGSVIDDNNAPGVQNPVLAFDARVNYNPQNNPSTAVVTRPLFTWNNNGASRMLMAANGNLGIGTQTPQQKLHVENGSVLINSTVPGDQSLFFRDVAAGNAFMGNWGIQYGVGSTIGVRGLNFWKPFGSPGATGNYFMFMKDNGNVGIGSGDPTAQLHTTGTVRFAGLTAANHTDVVVIDGTGNLAKRPYAAGTSLACATINQVPKVTGANTLGCSQIFDNGTSVGIGISAGFGFTSPAGSGVLIPAGWVAPANFKLYVNGATRSSGFFAISDERFKKDIKPLADPLERLSKLDGVSYDWRKEEFKDRDFGTGRQLGFIAQDLAKVVPEAVVVDDQGYYSVNYDMMIPLLVEGVKEQRSVIDEKQSQIDALTSRLERLEAMITSDGKRGEVAPGMGKPELFQNTPNPFNEATVIRYSLPEECGKCAIEVMDMNGRVVSTFGNLGAGQGQLMIAAGALSAGSYTYTMIVNGERVDSKKMVITR